ncbi:MAG TPA: portal protein, partial [Stellaceae bacterium]|nr:portal protein [Stellaceae bacterium]
ASDARWAHIAEMMPRDQFKEEYPDAEQMPWPLQSTSPINYGTWADEYAIRVCEYFEITREKRTLVRLANGHVGWKEFLSKEALGEDDRNIIESRESWEKTMTWYKLTAVQVLEWTTWPIEMIPIVRTVGAEVNVEGKTHVWGIVRQARDAQRAYNYWRSKEAESIALIPNSPYVAAEGQIENYEQDWKTANQKPIPVLTYNPQTYEGHLLPPPHREPPPQVPTAYVQAAKGAEEDMMGTTGVRFSATPQERVYDESGRALREVRKSGDIGTFHYVDNFAQALRRTGEIYLAIMKAVMVEPRYDTVMEEDGKDKLVKFDPNAAKPYAKGKHPVTSKTIEIVNPMLGQYGTTVAIGPDYATKRVESRESMMDLARAVGPDKTGLVADIIARNEDFPGKDEIAERWAAALPPGLVRPKMDDVPPQVQAVIGQMQQKIAQDAQQMQAMMKQLNDRQQEFGLQRDKQEKDFEAKVLGIVQKAEAANQAHFGSQLKDLAEAVKSMERILSAPAGAQANGAT